ncbi:MAG: hypothetical protein R2854_29280 [Caldilineaceae bacterium]
MIEICNLEELDQVFIKNLLVRASWGINPTSARTGRTSLSTW